MARCAGPLNCHCYLYQKQHGATFRSWLRVRESDFKWLKGEELVRYYESSPDFHRGFCVSCGLPIVNRPGPNSKNARIHKPAEAQLGVSLGILDDDPPVSLLATSLSAARLPGSKSPTIFRNTQNTHHRLKS